jgi:NADP-dependent 3-hydroxy acid dehydrogenase YdfG
VKRKLMNGKEWSTSTSKEFCTAASPIFKKQESGHFINLSSAAGVKKYFSPRHSVYSGTKFEVSAISEGFTSRSREVLGLRQLHLVRLNLN